MTVSPDNWKLFDDPKFELTVRYPNPTPQGREAHVVEHPQDDGIAVHLVRDERELYVEISRFPLVGAEAEYARHRPRLEERWGAGVVSDLREATLGRRAAQQYVFRWPEGERTAVLASTDGWTYRVLYNSASSLNAEVLRTLEWK